MSYELVYCISLIAHYSLLLLAVPACRLITLRWPDCVPLTLGATIWLRRPTRIAGCRSSEPGFQSSENTQKARTPVGQDILCLAPPLRQPERDTLWMSDRHNLPLDSRCRPRQAAAEAD